MHLKYLLVKGVSYIVHRDNTQGTYEQFSNVIFLSVCDITYTAGQELSRRLKVLKVCNFVYVVCTPLHSLYSPVPTCFGEFNS